MKIEAGKYYKTRNGRKVGPISSSKDSDYAFYGKVEGGKTRIWQQYGSHGGGVITREEDYDLIAEWTDAPAEPKLWRDMTPAEKGALLLAHHEGKVIEALHCDIEGWETSKAPAWFGCSAYRVKPADAVVETVTIHTDGRIEQRQDFFAMPFKTATHKITFNLIDGKPDCDSIRMEAIE